jgi:hypothetical protein
MLTARVANTTPTLLLKYNIIEVDDSVDDVSKRVRTAFPGVVLTILTEPPPPV